MSKLWKAFALAVVGILLFAPIPTAGQDYAAPSPLISDHVRHVSPEWQHWGPGYYFGGPNQGALRIKTDSRWASVFVDRHYVGMVNDFAWLTLLPGTHSVVLRDTEGVVLFQQNVKIKIGKLSTLDFRS